MPGFEYKALTAKGKKKSGIIDADGQADAQEKLKKQGLFPIFVSKIEQTTGQGNTVRRADLSFLHRIQSSEIAMITRLISTLLSAGFPLVKTVSTVMGQTRSKTFQKALSTIKDAIEEGSSFADALALYPRIFSPVYINMVSAGEASGTLEVVLERLADFAEQREETKKKIQVALAYPMIMAVLGFLVLVILLAYIVPGIIDIFSDMNQALPVPTLILLGMSNFFESFWWAIVLFPVILTGGLVMIRRTPKGALLTDQLVISMPIAGSLVQKLVAARFTRTLGSLLGNGVPMLTALRITQTIAGNRVIANLIEMAAKSVEQGGELGEVLSNNPYFPSLASQMIKVGEKSGEMEKMLEKTADLFEKDVQASVATATAFVEPMIILIMGVLVGLIIMGISLPIVEMNQMII